MLKNLRNFNTERLDTLFNALEVAADGNYAYLCDIEHDYSRWSKKAISDFGLPSEYMVNAGGIWAEHIHPEDVESYNKSISRIFDGTDSEHVMQYRAQKVNGKYIVCTCKGVVINDKDGKPEYFGGIIKSHEDSDSIDSLTGLRNQYGFFEDLTDFVRNNQRITLCMVGIARFTEINEIYGYLFGNKVLKIFGRKLFDDVGDKGNIYRLDGTKFAIITPSMNGEDVKEGYKNFRSYLRNGLTIDEKDIILDLNAGYLELNNFLVDVRTIYTCLNFAYERSKYKRQGDIVEFYNDLGNENKQRIEKLTAIRSSITQDFKGYKLFYQPVIDANNENIVGAESLIRWENDTYGMVPPDQFIPLLEHDSLFSILGKWILEKSIKDAKNILKRVPNFVVNVNLSYTQLEKPDFVDMVLDVLRQENFPANHLCLEITERCRLLSMNLLKNTIIRLKAQGIRFALDDFGTGFSSIGVIKEIPFDTIKIDKSFVSQIEKDNSERKLVEYFTGLASTFGAKVCVEGIETTGMRDILKEYNVNTFQGYLFGKPMALNNFDELLNKNSKV